MAILLALTIIIAVLIDFFSSSAISFLSLNLGFLLIIFLIFFRHYNRAFFAALFYGFLLDAISPITVFGTFITAHLIVYVIAKRLNKFFINISRRLLLILIFLGACAYMIIIAIAQYISINIFTSFSASISDLISIKSILLSSGLTVLSGVIFFALFMLGKIIFKKWFFIK